MSAVTAARLRRSPEALRGALVLLVSTVVALAWANLPGGGYETFWHLPIGLDLGAVRFELDLKHWVDDALVALFFAQVTLEVRRELELGELRDRRRAAAPVLAAGAGLVVPALTYVALTWGTDAVGGWGVVVSTDTAFVLGVLALVGRGVPSALRAFLVTLVVADDIGALAVVAFAYTDDFTPLPLLLAAAGLALIALMRSRGVWRGPLYLVPSVVVWVGFLLSGVHATLAGVAIAALLPVFPARVADLRRAQHHVRAFQMSPTAVYARTAEDALARTVSINERAHRALTPYVTWLVLPVFALANAGVAIGPDSLAHAAGSHVTWGIVAGLVVGKPAAIVLATWLVTRVRPDALGTGIRMPHVAGVGLLAGMGFTIALFVTELAFDDPLDVSAARIGVIAATVLAGLLGAAAFAALGVRERRRSPHRGRLVRPLDPSRDPVLGDPGSAVVAVVEYGNYATPFAPGAAEMQREMASRFGCQVVYAFRHLPLAEPLGREAALATEAAGLQGRFWQMRDALLREAPLESERQIRRAAAHAGLNLRRFELDRRRAGAERLDEDVTDARTMDLRRAPAYFIDDVRYLGSVEAGALIEAVARARARDEAMGRMRVPEPV